MFKKKRIIRFFIYLVYYLFYSFIFLGWLLHKTRGEFFIFHYGKVFTLFLCVMSLPFFLPILIHIALKFVSKKELISFIIILICFMFVLYFTFSLVYYHGQKHLFNPFLQRSSIPFEVSKEKGGGVFRILVLGDSVTRCEHVPKDVDKWPNVLGEVLQKEYPKIKIEILNGGQDFYTSKHSLIAYVTQYQDWNPDLVIAMYGMTDLFNSFSPTDFSVGEYNEQYTHFYGPAIRGAKPVTFERYILNIFFDRNRWYEKFRYNTIEYPLEKYKSIAAYENFLRKIINAVDSDIILVTMPFLYKDNMSDEELEKLVFGKLNMAGHDSSLVFFDKPSYKSLKVGMESINAVTKKVAISENVLLLDAETKIEKNLENFVDDVHYTLLGSRQMGKIIADEIIKSKIIEQIIEKK